MTIDQTWQPSSRSQWTVAVMAVLVCAALASGLPRLADATAPDDTEVTAGERIELGGVSVEVPAGWVLPGDATLVVLDKGSAKFILFPPAADATPPTDAVVADAANYPDATVGDTTTFTTESGLAGASIILTGTDGLTTMLYALSDGTNLVRGQTSAPTDEWEAIEPEVQAMLGTVEITGVPSP
jgi:hypothetical protein